MPTGDTFGGLTFPVPSTGGGDVPGDPLIGYLLSYLKAAVNSACGTRWNVLCPQRLTVKHTFAHDPQQLFEENRLPAIYCWRGASKRERIATGLTKRTTDLQIAWVNEPAQESHMALRNPFMNAIAAAIDNAITGERDPAWIVTGDTDPRAVTLGSHLLTWAGIERIQPTGDRPQSMTFHRIEQAQPLEYYGFVLTAQVEEVGCKNAAFGVEPNKSDATITTNADTIAAQHWTTGTPPP